MSAGFAMGSAFAILPACAFAAAAYDAATVTVRFSSSSEASLRATIPCSHLEKTSNHITVRASQAPPRAGSKSVGSATVSRIYGDSTQP